MKTKDINARNRADLTYGLTPKIPKGDTRLENIRAVLGHNLHKKLQEAPVINTKVKDIEVDEITDKIKEYQRYINIELPENDLELLEIHSTDGLIATTTY
jgi:hypothetical protein